MCRTRRRRCLVLEGRGAAHADQRRDCDVRVMRPRGAMREEGGGGRRCLGGGIERYLEGAWREVASIRRQWRCRNARRRPVASSFTKEDATVRL